MAPQRNQRGLVAVEFAFVGLVFFTVMFGLIDLSRIFFDLAVLDEATRRGARIAAVCTVGDPLVKQVAIFNSSGGSQSQLIPTFGTQHILVQYLDADGADITAPADAGYPDIRYVRVSIQDFQLQTFIPGLTTVLSMPAFATTIPSESLGRVGTVDVAC